MKSFISILISFHLVFAHPAFALDVEIKSALNLRSDTSDGRPRLTVKRTLPKGTVLRIPDGFLLDKDGKETVDPKKADHQRTLLKWLENDKTVVREQSYNNLITGKLDIETFFPVTVVSLPTSHENRSGFNDLIGKTGLMALGVLARKKTNGLELINTAPTELVVESKENADVAKVENTTTTEADTCAAGNCESVNPEPQPSSLFENLNNDLEKILEKLDENAKNKVGHKPINDVITNFNKNCYGVQFNDFKKFLLNKAEANKIPAEIMLGIMTQETATKNCKSISFEYNKDRTKIVSKNVGLFQINTNTITNMNECNAIELKKLSEFKGTLEEMESRGPQCLNNPAINTSLGFKVLLDKYNIVNNREPLPPYDNKGWGNQTIEYKDKFRRAISAYNGGQSWIIGGKIRGGTTVGADRELEIASSKFSPQLTPAQLKSWKYTRLMVFHRQLEENTNVYETYGLSHKGDDQRSKINNMNNMSYVDAVTGTDPASSSYIDFATQWSKELYGDKK